MGEDQNIEYKQSWRDEYLKYHTGAPIPVTVPVTAPVIMEILNSKEYVDALISLFSEKQERSSREIMEAWGLLSLRYVRLNYITPLLKAGILRLKYPDNPNHPQQRYLLNEIK